MNFEIITGLQVLVYALLASFGVTCKRANIDIK